jgi:hypothetical protein
MAKKKKFAFPKQAYIYVYDYEDGKPIFALTEMVDEIPADCSGNPVGIYSLESSHVLEVKRTLG